MTSTSRTRPGSRPPAEPPRISGLTFIRPLGSGGFADVFLYQQDSPSRLVAVKVLVAEMAGTEAAARLRREADAMAGLSQHPSIVTVFSSGVADDGRAYMVMEYYPKPALSESLATTRRSVPNVLSIGIQLAGAVESAHRLGILHRDIKPGNILVDRAGRPVLGDFGISMTSAEAASGGASGLSVPYSPPEAFEAVSHPMPQSDVWSLAATLYASLAGRAPFEIPGGNNGVSAMTERIKHSPYIPIGRADVPPSLDQVLSTAMAKSPDSRYWAMRAFGRALGSVEQEMRLPGTPMEVIDTEGEGAVDAVSTATLGTQFSPTGGQQPPAAPPPPSARDLEREDSIRTPQAAPELSLAIDQSAATLLGIPGPLPPPKLPATSSEVPSSMWRPSVSAALDKTKQAASLPPVDFTPVVQRFQSPNAWHSGWIAAVAALVAIILIAVGAVNNRSWPVIAGLAILTVGIAAVGILLTRHRSLGGDKSMYPVGVALDRLGNVVVADRNGYVRKITRDGALSVLAGDGDTDGNPLPGYALASPLAPISVAVDEKSNVYVADFNGYVEMITPRGILTIVAGNGNREDAPVPGVATDSPMDPNGVAVDSAGNLFIADSHGYVIKVTPSGVLSIVAGDGDRNGVPVPGSATDSPMDPWDVAVDDSGNIYIADRTYVEKVTPDGELSVVAGTGSIGEPCPGPALNSPIAPRAIDAKPSGAIYVADAAGYLLKISRSGNLTILAEPADGPTADILLDPWSITVSGTDEVFVAANRRVMMFTSDRMVVLVGSESASSHHSVTNSSGEDSWYTAAHSA